MKTSPLKMLVIGNEFFGVDIINFLKRGVKTPFLTPYISKNHNKTTRKVWKWSSCSPDLSRHTERHLITLELRKNDWKTDELSLLMDKVGKIVFL